MNQEIKSIMTIVFITSAILMLSGCGPMDWLGKKAVEKNIESQTGGKVDINSDNGTTNINTDKGSLSAGKEAKIPDNFPKDIFMYPDAQVTFAMSGTSEENSFSVAYNTSATPEDTFSKYKEEMAKNEWKKDTELNMGAQGKVLNFKKDNLNVAVTVETSQNPENAGKTTITVTGGADKNPASSQDAPTESGGGANPQ